ncbi:DNA recombination protein RmuC [Oceaniserpentilla sp. 4NH20-0058]|uniref:DNA recombination protein RmuC n=1 Tax=Oceaniserpentilla sp. 4NH20-0058 TaxID=3127660 RepID=UPI0031076BD9
MPLEIALYVGIIAAFGGGLFVMQRQFSQQRQTFMAEKQVFEQNLQDMKTSQEQYRNDLQQAQTQLALKESHIQHSEQQLSQAQQQLSQTQIQLDQHREQLQSAQGQLKHQQATLEQRQLDVQKLNEKEAAIEQLNQHISNLKTRLNQEQVERQKDQQNLEEKLELLKANKTQLSQEFENLSNKIFEEKNQQFKQTSQEGLSNLLNPFKEQLEGLKKKVDDAYVEEGKDRAALKAQIGELHNLNKQITEEAASLARALRGEKKTQGNWGELVLETVLEKSGLRQGAEYVREKSINNEEGVRYRPDVIINLPEGKHLVVDAKVSLNAYTDYINAENEADRISYLKQHVDAVRMHIKTLSEKSYAELPDLQSPDFVFMFMPIEPAFMVAFEHDDKLFNDAFEKRIVVVTPTTLLASLRTVASLWSIERQNTSAKKLADQAAKVHDKLVGFVESMEKVGSQLQTVQGTYDKAWGQLKEGRGNLISQAHKFKDLGVRTKKELSATITESSELEFEDENTEVRTTKSISENTENQVEFELNN